MNRKSRCEHDPAEQETAVFADRLCPLCLVDRIAELEASALSGYEDGWHKLRSERDELKAALRDTLTEIAEAACMPFPDLATKDEVVARVAELEADITEIPTAIRHYQQRAEAAESRLADLIAMFTYRKGERFYAGIHVYSDVTAELQAVLQSQ
jgi:hypothetical protein